MDLYLLNTIMSGLWYVFTILFVLYRFTTFFTYLYNFTRFLGKLFTGFTYLTNNILDYIRKKRGYIQVNTEEHDEDIRLLINDEPPRKTFYQITKNYINESYTYIKEKIMGRKYNGNQLNNLYEERVSSTGFRNSEYKSNSSEFNLQDNSQTASNINQYNTYFPTSNFINSQLNVNSNLTQSLLDDQYDNDKQNYFESVSLYNANIDSEEERVLHSSIFSTFTESKQQFDKSPFHNLMNNPVNSNKFNELNNNPYNVDSSNMLFDSNFINQQLRKSNSNKFKSSYLSKSLKNIKSDSFEDKELEPKEEINNNLNSFHSDKFILYSNDLSSSNLKKKGQYKDDYRDTSSRFITDPYESQLSRNPYI